MYDDTKFRASGEYTTAGTPGQMNTVLDAWALHPGDDTHENEPPHVEIARLREDVADLRASALRWRALYENALRRAKDLEEKSR